MRIDKFNDAYIGRPISIGSTVNGLLKIKSWKPLQLSNHKAWEWRAFRELNFLKSRNYNGLLSYMLFFDREFSVLIFVYI